MKRSLICIFLILNSCDASNREEAPIPMQEIKGRDNDTQAFAVYRARVPESWIRRDPLPDESLVDTRKALVEFIITDQAGMIRIWVHNFPTDKKEEKIPPQAQVERWHRQFEILYPHETETAPQAFSGFEGLVFSGTGKLKGTEKAVLAWALKIAEPHNQLLRYPAHREQAALYKQMRADVTLKAEGPPEAMRKQREAIVDFAHSFELIEEIPDPW